MNVLPDLHPHDRELGFWLDTLRHSRTGRANQDVAA